jgi:hypothetical protein
MQMHLQFIDAVLIRTLMKMALGKRNLKQREIMGPDRGPNVAEDTAKSPLRTSKQS